MRVHHANAALRQLVEDDWPFKKAGQVHQAIGECCLALALDDGIDDMAAKKMKIDACGEIVSVDAALERGNCFFGVQRGNRCIVFARQVAVDIEVGFQFDTGN